MPLASVRRETLETVIRDYGDIQIYLKCKQRETVTSCGSKAAGKRGDLDTCAGVENAHATWIKLFGF